MSAEVTTYGRLAMSPVVASNGSLAANNLLLNFSAFAKGFNENIADANALTGKLSRRLNRVRTTHYNVSPRLEMQPTAVELARILDATLGAAPSGTTYALGNDVRKFTAMYDDNNTVWSFNELAVASLTLRSSDTDPTLTASMGLLGKQVSPGATFPVGLASAVVDDTTETFIHTDTTASGTSAVVLNGLATMVSSIEIDIDNGLDSNRFFNAQYLTGFVKRDRNISVKLNYPYGEYPTLYNDAATENAGITVVITYTNGGTSLVLTFPAVLFPRTAVEIQGRTEVMHQLSGTAYATASVEAMVLTLDSTP